jgi:hypothetical protein
MKNGIRATLPALAVALEWPKNVGRWLCRFSAQATASVLASSLGDFFAEV